MGHSGRVLSGQSHCAILRASLSHYLGQDGPDTGNGPALTKQFSKESCLAAMPDVTYTACTDVYIISIGSVKCGSCGPAGSQSYHVPPCRSAVWSPKNMSFIVIQATFLLLVFFLGRMLNKKHNNKKATLTTLETKTGRTVNWLRGERREHNYTRLSLHCQHQNDSCTKMGSDESHFNMIIVTSEGQSHN